MWHLYLPIAGNSVNVILIFIMGGFVGLLSGIFGGGRRLSNDAPFDHGRYSAHRGRGLGFQPDRGRFHFRHPGPLPIGQRGFQNGRSAAGRRRGGRNPWGSISSSCSATMGNADFLIQITYVIMLGFVGGYMFLESMQGAQGCCSGRGRSRQGVRLFPSGQKHALADPVRQIGYSAFHPDAPFFWAPLWASWPRSWG